VTDAAPSSAGTPRSTREHLHPHHVALGHWVAHGLALAELALDAVTRPGPDAHKGHGSHDGRPARHPSVDRVILESAVLVRVVGPAHSARATRVADRLLDLATSDDARLALALDPAAAIEQAAAYLVLRDQRPDPRLDDLVCRAETARVTVGRERLPHRDLERTWLRGLLAGRHDVTTVDVRRTVLGGEVDVLDVRAGNRDDLRAFTHALRYATDFGLHPSSVPPELVPGLLGQAQSALAGALDDEDWALAGELLMTWPLLGVPAGADASAALAVVLELAESVGTLPAPVTPVDLDGLTSEERADAIVLSTCHTGFVLALLAALAPRVAWASPAPDLNGPSLRDAWLVGDERPTWHDLPYAALPGSAGPAVALVSDARVRRLARDRRYADLAATLALPGVPTTPATLQARELLDRLDHLSDDPA